jgi:flagellar biosynthesis/type III secretory pathway protein FliH
MDGLISDFLRPDSPSISRSAGGVLFIEDFDEPPPACTADQPVIIAPSYTAEDVEAAREHGRHAALEDQAAVHGALVHAALTAIADELAKSRQDAVALATAHAEQIAGSVLALLTACLPATAARVAPAEIRALTDALLPPLAREPGVDLRVHPDMLAAISDSLATLRDVTVTGDPALHISDVAIQWRDGEARRDWKTLWAGITASLPALALPDDLTQLMIAGDGNGQ